MKYCFFVTSEMKRKISERNLSKVISEKLESDLASNHQLSTESNTTTPRVKIQRINIPGGPRLIFFEEIRDNTTLYVLREIYEDHDLYMRKFNNMKDINLWISWYEYTEEELAEIDSKFDSLRGDA